MTSDRGKAGRLALEKIDRHPNEYTTRQAQDKMLQQLIVQHQFETQMTSKSKPELMGLWKYRGILEYIATSHCVGDAKAKIRIQQLFQKGSSIVKPEYLELFGYQSQVPAASDAIEISDDEQEGETSDLVAATINRQKFCNVSRGDTADMPKEEQQDPSNAGATRQPHVPCATKSGQDQNGEAHHALRKGRPSPKVLPNEAGTDRTTGTGDKRKRDASIGHDERPSKTVKLADSSLPTTESAISSTGQQSNAKPGVSGKENLQRIREDKHAARGPSKISADRSKVGGQLGSAEFNRSRCLAVDPKEITNKLKWIEEQVRGWSNDLLEKTGVDPKSRAMWVEEPSKELQTIYKRVFGDRWQSMSSSMTKSEDFTASKAIQCCLYAAVYDATFVDRLTCLTPDEDNDWLTTKYPLLDDILDEHTIHDPKGGAITMRTVLRRAANQNFRDDRFFESEVLPAAKQRANALLQSMKQQLQLLGATEVVKPEDKKGFWTGVASQLDDIFKAAFMIKGLISTSRQDFDHKWFISGTEMMPEITEGMVVGNVLTRVMFCQTPAIWMLKPDGWYLECPAKVWHTRT